MWRKAVRYLKLLLVYMTVMCVVVLWWITGDTRPHTAHKYGDISRPVVQDASDHVDIKKCKYFSTLYWH